MNASLAVEDNADCLEKACMEGSTGFLAWTDVIRDLRLTVSEDEAVVTYGEPEEGQSYIEPFETILEQWREVLTHRDQACGPGSAYPFEITRQGLKLRRRPSPAYLFQLLASLGSSNKHPDGTTVSKMFEELSAAAAGRYLGDSKTSVVFGSPRRDLPTGFRAAVAHLVDLLREGKACKDREGIEQLKDDGLDVVAWREFPDRKASKLILFGQCTVGRHWEGKAYELQPKRWCKRNFAAPLAMDPIPAFFVPRALSEKDAKDVGIDQILLDRCRISALCSGTLDDRLERRLWDWIDASLQRTPSVNV